MAQPIFTFSVSEYDSDNLARVKKLKEHCKQTGKSFSWVILTALKNYEEQNLNEHA